MKRALIVINAYSQLPHSLHQSARLREELQKAGIVTDIRPNDFFVAVDGTGALSSTLAPYDFCIYLDKDKYTSLLLEKTGLRLFNRHAAIRACDDKMTTHILLSDHGIPMPKTLPGLLCYDEGAEISQRQLASIEAQLDYPMVVKTCYGSLGKGVHLVHDRPQLQQVSQALMYQPHLYQQYIAASHGKDVRVIVVGSRVIAAMLRRSDGDFRSNLEIGGVGTPYQPPTELAQLCLKAADILQLDYCGVDILFGDNGYLVCEVNSNAFFGGIEQVTHCNVAHAYAQYIIRQVYGE